MATSSAGTAATSRRPSSLVSHEVIASPLGKTPPSWLSVVEIFTPMRSVCVAPAYGAWMTPSSSVFHVASDDFQSALAV